MAVLAALACWLPKAVLGQPAVPLELPPPLEGVELLLAEPPPASAQPCEQIYRQTDCCRQRQACREAWSRIETNLVRDYPKDLLDITPLYRPSIHYEDDSPVDQDRLRRGGLAVGAMRPWRNAQGERLLLLGEEVLGLEEERPPPADPVDPDAPRPVEFQGRVVRYAPGETEVVVESDTGLRFTFPLEKLSLDDRYWIQGRPWRDVEGRLLAHGRLEDYRWGRVHIRTGDGPVVVVPAEHLGEDEFCYVGAYWGDGVGLPRDCRLRGEPKVRDFTLLTYTWTASALCHKPLYFEEVQFERYGHTAGPLVQPVISGAHFFANIAILPYKMGIHPPGECVYALGYFRPGSCAPYMIPPVPLSIRGGLYQAAAVTGAAAVIP